MIITLTQQGHIHANGTDTGFGVTQAHYGTVLYRRETDNVSYKEYTLPFRRYILDRIALIPYGCANKQRFESDLEYFLKAWQCLDKEEQA